MNVMKKRKVMAALMRGGKKPLTPKSPPLAPSPLPGPVAFNTPNVFTTPNFTPIDGSLAMGANAGIVAGDREAADASKATLPSVVESVKAAVVTHRKPLMILGALALGWWLMKGKR